MKRLLLPLVLILGAQSSQAMERHDIKTKTSDYLFAALKGGAGIANSLLFGSAASKIILSGYEFHNAKKLSNWSHFYFSEAQRFDLKGYFLAEAKTAHWKQAFSRSMKSGIPMIFASSIAGTYLLQDAFQIFKTNKTQNKI